MKTKRVLMICTGLCALMPFAMVRQSAAQDTAQPVVYAAYYECDPNQQARVDSLISSFWAPLVDRHIAAKHVTAWGWSGHHTGSTWSRVFYVVSPDVGNAVDAVEGLLADARKANAEALRETTAACPTHEDYIWQRVAGSQPSAELGRARPAAGLSIYYECNPAREQRADALVTSTFTPTFSALVQSGELNSWGWLQHIVGGKYRRLLLMDGRDAKTLLAVTGKLVTELRAKQAAAFGEFSDICSSHQDVIWNIMVAKP